MLPNISIFGQLEGVYTWNFIPEWNSSRDEIIPAYGEMSHTVYTFLPRWNFIPGWKIGVRFHPGMKKEKTCEHFIQGWNLKWACFFNFWRMYSSMFSKFNMFEQNESTNIMKHRPLCKKWSPKRKRMSSTSSFFFLLFSSLF